MAGEYSGSALHVTWGGTVLTSDFRTFSHEETADEIDATAGSDARKVYLNGPVDDTVSMGFIDLNTGTTNWQGPLMVGRTGTLIYSPNGTAAGQPKYTAGARITKRSRSIPYNDVVAYDITWRFTSDLTSGTN